MRDASPANPAAPSGTGTGPAARPSALTMNVMRLTSPLPQLTNPLPFIPSTISESTSTPSDELLTNIPPWEGEGAPCGVGYLSVLPSSLGSIYASETFRSFLSVFNASSDPAHNVALTVHIQTASQRIVPLLDTGKNPRPVLQPRASINNIVKAKLPELGVHKLFCSASYDDPLSTTGQLRTLQQVFRFNVLPPLEPSLSVIPLYRGLESFSFPPPAARLTSNFVHYLVDLRVLNAVPVPVYETEATFVPKPPFRVQKLLGDSANAFAVPDSDLDPEEAACVLPIRNASMGVGDTRNFLFHVYRALSDSDVDGISSALAKTTLSSASASNITKPSLQRTDGIVSKGANPVRSASEAPPGSARHGQHWRPPDSGKVESAAKEMGHLTISWRSAHGEVGHLDNVVTAFEPTFRHHDIEVAIYAVPEEIHTHRPFLARCAARNNTTRAVRLYLQVRRDLVGEIVPVGVSGVSLGEVQPGCTVRCSITLIPLARGQHSISGVRVVDIDTNMSYKADPPMLSVL